MKRPTTEELNEAYQAIKQINIDRLNTYGVLASKGPFVIIGRSAEMTQQQVKYILKDNVKTWKAVHYKIYGNLQEVC